MTNYDEYLDNFSSIYNAQHTFNCGDCSFSSKYKYNLQRHINTKVCRKDQSKLIEELQERIERLEKERISTINNASDHGINNVGRDAHIHDNRMYITNNINNYSKEDISSITVEKMLEIGRCPPEALSKLIEEIHFKIPENRNIDLPNIRGNYAKIRENNTWIFVRLVQLLEDLVVDNCNRLTDFIKQYGDMLPLEWVKGIDKMTTKIEETSNRNVQKEMIKNVMISNRHKT